MKNVLLLGSFSASPNPASTSLNIDALEDAPPSVTISNLKDNCVKEIRNYEREIRY